MIIVITVTTVIIIVPTFFTIISPQLLVIVSDGRGDLPREQQWSQAAGEFLAYGRRGDMVKKYHCY